MRLDLVLRRHLTDLNRATRTRVQAWIENGLVTVNGAPVRRVAARAAFGDVVSVVLPEPAPRTKMGPEDIGLDVLYEDDHLLAIDKPAGLVVHPTYKHATGTMMNALLWHARAWPAPQRPSLVSRLDKLTSGIIVVAKTAAAHAALQRALSSTASSKDSEKDYLAVVYGRVNVARGEIDLRLARVAGRSPQGRRVGDRGGGEPHAIRAARARGRAARGAVAAPLPPGHRAHASDPRAPGGARLAARRRPGIRRAAMVADRRSAAGRDAARVSAAGAARVARGVHASDHARDGQRSPRQCRAFSISRTE